MGDPLPVSMGVDHDRRDIASVARGDQAALGGLYDRYAPKMLALGVRILGNRREAEDVLHDVFVEVWKRAGDYDPRRGSVKTWLFLRMRSRSLDRVRSARIARARPLPDDERGLGSVSSGAEGVVDGGFVRAALAELPDDQRDVLLLGYFEGLSCSEISTELDIPIGTVKSRAAAALRKLRTRLEPGVMS